MDRRGSSRGSWALIAVALVVGAAAIVIEISQLLPSDSATKASVDEALIRFRHEMKGAPVRPRLADHRVPSPGVYRYATQGAEEINGFEFDTAHSYNGVSTISLVPSHCGELVRWQPLVSRWNEAELCLAQRSSRVAVVRDFHDFFEHSKLVRYLCEGGAAPYAPELRPGLHWAATCTSRSGRVTSTTKVVDFARVEVAGRRVAAVHLHTTTKLSGDPRGNETQDSWISRGDGLLLRRTDSSAAHVDASGGGQFAEHYVITLQSPRPRR